MKKKEILIHKLCETALLPVGKTLYVWAADGMNQIQERERAPAELEFPRNGKLFSAARTHHMIIKRIGMNGRKDWTVPDI